MSVSQNAAEWESLSRFSAPTTSTAPNAGVSTSTALKSSVPVVQMHRRSTAQPSRMTVQPPRVACTALQALLATPAADVRFVSAEIRVRESSVQDRSRVNCRKSIASRTHAHPCQLASVRVVWRSSVPLDSPCRSQALNDLSFAALTPENPIVPRCSSASSSRVMTTVSAVLPR